MRTRLHDDPVCKPCREGDHEDCYEELGIPDEDFLCGCADDWHFIGEDAEEDAEW